MRNAETIAKELRVDVVPVNPLNYNWTEEMVNTAKSLRTKEDTAKE